MELWAENPQQKLAENKSTGFFSGKNSPQKFGWNDVTL